MPLSDDEARERLRELKRQLQQANDLDDRFDDARLGGNRQKLQAEIDALPLHVRQADEAEFKLQLLTCAVEDYLVARAAQFLPDVDDLWAAVQTMQERRDKPETPAEKPVVQLLDELRPLPASTNEVKQAVLRAALLDAYKQPVYRSLSAARRMNPPRDYRVSLRRQAAEFLAKTQREGAVRSGLPSLDDSAALVALVHAWQHQTPEEARGGTYWTRFARQSILSDINVLRKLGLADAEIDGLLVDAYNQWQTRN